MGMARLLNEITERLLADDWCRFSLDDDQSFYYVVGLAAYDKEVLGRGSVRCSGMEMAGTPSERPKRVSPDYAWFVRSQLGSKHPDYMAAARKRLRAAGVSNAQMDAFLANPKDWEGGWTLARGVSVQEFAEAMAEFLGACRVARGDYEPGPDEQVGVDDARERIFLQRLANRYSSSLKRASLLEALAFEDPQLYEAAECHLLGFYRATTMLSAAALERHLASRLRAPERTEAARLVGMALQRGLLDEADKARAERVFWLRNRVAHDGYVPEAVDAEFALDHSRSLIGQVRA